jgi:hypothetical protein
LDGGNYVTIQDLTDAEKISPSYLSRVLPLALPAPGLQLDALLKPLPAEWKRHKQVLQL